MTNNSPNNTSEPKYKFVVLTYQYDSTGYHLGRVLEQQTTLYAKNNKEAVEKALVARTEDMYRGYYVWGGKVLSCEEIEYE